MHQILGFETDFTKFSRRHKNETGFLKSGTGLSRNETRFSGDCNHPLSFY